MGRGVTLCTQCGEPSVPLPRGRGSWAASSRRTGPGQLRPLAQRSVRPSVRLSAGPSSSVTLGTGVRDSARGQRAGSGAEGGGHTERRGQPGVGLRRRPSGGTGMHGRRRPPPARPRHEGHEGHEGRMWAAAPPQGGEGRSQRLLCPRERRGGGGEGQRGADPPGRRVATTLGRRAGHSQRVGAGPGGRPRGRFSLLSCSRPSSGARAALPGSEVRRAVARPPGGADSPQGPDPNPLRRLRDSAATGDACQGAEDRCEAGGRRCCACGGQSRHPGPTTFQP